MWVIFRTRVEVMRAAIITGIAYPPNRPHTSVHVKTDETTDTNIQGKTFASNIFISGSLSRSSGLLIVTYALLAAIESDIRETVMEMI